MEKGGMSLMVKNQILNGVTDSGKIADNLGLPEKKVRSCRKTLKEWGVDWPLEKMRYEQIERMVLKENNDRKLQTMLDSFSSGTVLNMIKLRRQIAFAPLKIILQEIGINHDTQTAAEILRKTQIPIREVWRGSVKIRGQTCVFHYWVIVAKHKEKIIDALRKAGMLNQTARSKSIRGH